jgi:hypothetical protein
MRLDISHSRSTGSRCQVLDATSDSSELDEMMRVRENSPSNHPSSFSRRRADTEKLEAQLAEWTAVIAQFRASAKRSATGTGTAFDRTADELQSLRNEAGVQVMLLKSSVDLDWEDSVSELNRQWGRIRTTFKRAEARF